MWCSHFQVSTSLYCCIITFQLHAVYACHFIPLFWSVDCCCIVCSLLFDPAIRNPETRFQLCNKLAIPPTFWGLWLTSWCDGWCLFGSFVHVTIGRYHEGVTGDKYDNYRDIVRVCRELEYSRVLPHFTADLLFIDSPSRCHSDVHQGLGLRVHVLIDDVYLLLLHCYCLVLVMLQSVGLSK